MAETTPGMIFVNELRYGKPAAAAWIMGNAQNPQLSGLVQFFGTPYEGVLVEAEIFGLPNLSEKGSSDFYAMHIHEKETAACNLPKREAIIIPQRSPIRSMQGIWFL